MILSIYTQIRFIVSIFRWKVLIAFRWSIISIKYYLQSAYFVDPKKYHVHHAPYVLLHVSNETHKTNKTKRKRTADKNNNKSVQTKCKLFRSIQIEHTIDIMWGIFCFVVSSTIRLFESVYVPCRFALVMHSARHIYILAAQIGGDLVCSLVWHFLPHIIRCVRAIRIIDCSIWFYWTKQRQEQAHRYYFFYMVFFSSPHFSKKTEVFGVVSFLSLLLLQP